VPFFVIIIARADTFPPAGRAGTCGEMISIGSAGDQDMNALGVSRKEWVFNVLGLLVLLALCVV
jgi:hypothetical protein